MTTKQVRIRKSKIPYSCIRCGYSTSNKTDMKKHLYDLKVSCPATENLIELTDTIKIHILENRIYMLPKTSKNINIKKDKSLLEKLVDNAYYNYIYLIRPVESVLNNNNIYKIGMSIVKNKDCNITRLSSYKIGSEIILVSQCIDASKMEGKILERFNAEFKRAYGNEYFIGNKYSMMNIINNVLENEEKESICQEFDKEIENTLELNSN